MPAVSKQKVMNAGAQAGASAHAMAPPPTCRKGFLTQLTEARKFLSGLPETSLFGDFTSRQGNDQY